MTEEEATKAVEPVDAAEPAHEVSDVSTGTKRKVSSTELEGEDATTESVKRSKADDKEEEAAPEAAKEEVPAKKKDVKGKGKAKAKSKGKSRYAELDQEDDDDEDDDGDDGYDDGNLAEEEEDSLLEIDVANIIPGRRTRGKVIDYRKTLEELEKKKKEGIADDLLDDDDDEDDTNFQEPVEEE